MSLYFTLEEMREQLAAHEREHEEYDGVSAIEPVARTRRWLDMDGSSELFAAAARRLERSMLANDTGSPDGWARAGGLAHLAGDGDSRRLLSRAVKDGVEREPFLPAAPGTFYLLGDFDHAQAIARDGRIEWLAAAARTLDPKLAVRARDGWMAWESLSKGGPHHSYAGAPLTDWDWIEETFRLESELLGDPVPDHLEMLRRLGVLGDADEPIEATPPRPAPRVGWHIAFGDDAMPGLEVVDEDLVTAELAPDRILDLRRYSAKEGWGARLSTDPESSGEWILPPSEPDFQGAALWAAGWFELNGEPEAGELVRRLVAAHDAEDALE